MPLHSFSGQSGQEALEAKTWFRWTKELERGGDKVVWKPEEVRLDMHDNEKFNRIFTKSDHTLVIKDFRQCKLQSWIRFYVSALEQIRENIYYRPGSEGNVLTGVCDSFCP